MELCDTNLENIPLTFALAAFTTVVERTEGGHTGPMETVLKFRAC